MSLNCPDYWTPAVRLVHICDTQSIKNAEQGITACHEGVITNKAMTFTNISWKLAPSSCISKLQVLNTFPAVMFSLLEVISRLCTAMERLGIMRNAELKLLFSPQFLTLRQGCDISENLAHDYTYTTERQILPHFMNPHLLCK